MNEGQEPDHSHEEEEELEIRVHLIRSALDMAKARAGTAKQFKRLWTVLKPHIKPNDKEYPTRGGRVIKILHFAVTKAYLTGMRDEARGRWESRSTPREEHSASDIADQTQREGRHHKRRDPKLRKSSGAGG